jgi:hypothetical protein
MQRIAIVVLSGLIAACARPSRVPAAGEGTPNPDVVKQSYVKNGYEVVQRNGQVLHCRPQAITGTVFCNAAGFKNASDARIHQPPPDHSV